MNELFARTPQGERTSRRRDGIMAMSSADRQERMWSFQRLAFYNLARRQSAQDQH